MYKNYYHILGIDHTATIRQVKRVYRKLALKHHPDKNPDDKQAEERFKVILEAYQVLSDESKRRSYDLYWQAQMDVGYTPSAGEASARSSPRKPARKHQKAAEDKTVDRFSRSDFILHKFSEYLKNQKSSRPEAPVPKQKVECPRCNGRGLRWLIFPCYTCNGMGYYYQVNHREYEICPACRGHGWGEILFHECLCDYCHGQGVVKPQAPEQKRCFHCAGFGWTLKDSLWRKLLFYPHRHFLSLKEECYICEGTGFSPYRCETQPQKQCPKCKGYGWVGMDFLRKKRKCRRCEGSGQRQK
jgi:DnaJ-class molecular chaperone